FRVSTESADSRDGSRGADDVGWVCDVIRSRGIDRCAVIVGIDVSGYEILSVRNGHRPHSAPAVRIDIGAIGSRHSDAVRIHSVGDSKRNARLESRDSRKLPSAQRVTDNPPLISPQGQFENVCERRAMRTIEQRYGAVCTVASEEERSL